MSHLFSRWSELLGPEKENVEKASPALPAAEPPRIVLATQMKLFSTSTSSNLSDNQQFLSKNLAYCTVARALWGGDFLRDASRQTPNFRLNLQSLKTTNLRRSFFDKIWNFQSICSSHSWDRNIIWGISSNLNLCHGTLACMHPVLARCAN